MHSGVVLPLFICSFGFVVAVVVVLLSLSFFFEKAFFIFRNKLCKIFIFFGDYKACVSVQNISGVIKAVNRKTVFNYI